LWKEVDALHVDVLASAYAAHDPGFPSVANLILEQRLCAEQIARLFAIAASEQATREGAEAEARLLICPMMNLPPSRLGKAPTFSTSDTQAFKRAIDMTDDELAAIVGRAKLTVV
jgi:hypothetical protein